MAGVRHFQGASGWNQVLATVPPPRTGPFWTVTREGSGRDVFLYVGKP